MSEADETHVVGAFNQVDGPPSKLVLALQFWGGDLARAMRLARLLADIEGERRDDVVFAFCRRHDVQIPRELLETAERVSHTFRVMHVLCDAGPVGHPDGCFAVWSSVMDRLSAGWLDGYLQAHSVFTFESDGVPLRRDWIDQLVAEHARTLGAGKRVTGPEMLQGVPHLNGSLISHLSLWPDRPSLHRTPPGQAWDLFHAVVLAQEGRGTRAMQNVYCAANWSPESLRGLSAETAWLCSQKDDTALEWAERSLTNRR